MKLPYKSAEHAKEIFDTHKSRRALWHMFHACAYAWMYLSTEGSPIIAFGFVIVFFLSVMFEVGMAFAESVVVHGMKVLESMEQEEQA